MSLTFSSDFDAFSWQTFQIHFPIHFYSVDLVAVAKETEFFDNLLNQYLNQFKIPINTFQEDLFLLFIL